MTRASRLSATFQPAHPPTPRWVIEIPLRSLMLATLLLAGCGRVSPAGPLAAPETPKVAAKADVGQPVDMVPAVSTPVGMQMTGGLGTPGASAPGSVPGCDANAGCDASKVLVVGDVEKKKAGFLWRKLSIKGQVTNRAAQALSGEIMIRFKKGGNVVQSEYVAIAALAAGQSKGFEHTSAVAADDVEVTTRAL